MTQSKFKLPSGADKLRRAEVPEVDPKALEQFAAGAKDRRGPEAPLWEPHDPRAKPKYSVSMRLNKYHLEMLRFLSEIEDVSQNRILRRQLLPIIEKMAKEEFEKQKDK